MNEPENTIYKISPIKSPFYELTLTRACRTVLRFSGYDERVYGWAVNISRKHDPEITNWIKDELELF